MPVPGGAAKGAHHELVGNYTSSFSQRPEQRKTPGLTYRRFEPGKERAHGRRIAGDLATRNARGRAGRDRTKDAALNESVEQGMAGGTAAR